jgi:hypothetical protein
LVTMQILLCGLGQDLERIFLFYGADGQKEFINLYKA